MVRWQAALLVRRTAGGSVEQPRELVTLLIYVRLSMPENRDLVTERNHSVAEGMRTAAGLARMKARQVELAGDLSGCDEQTGEAFEAFAAELEMVADQIAGRAPQGR